MKLFVVTYCTLAPFASFVLGVIFVWIQRRVKKTI
jgi:hypothetical protein